MGEFWGEWGCEGAAGESRAPSPAKCQREAAAPLSPVPPYTDLFPAPSGDDSPSLSPLACFSFAYRGRNTDENLTSVIETQGSV